MAFVRDSKGNPTGGSYVSEAQAKAREKRAAKQVAKAAVRNRIRKERASRSPAEQLRLLDRRFGKGKGAGKERARLVP